MRAGSFELRSARPWPAGPLAVLSMLVPGVPGGAAAAERYPGAEPSLDTVVVYTADLLSNLQGGIETGFRYLDNLELVVQKRGLLARGRYRDRGQLVLLYNNRTTAGELVGDLQGVSNIDAGGDARVYEAWYEFATAGWSLRTGLYDLNSEFDAGEAGSFFINSSHGIGPDFAQTGENGPGIFPVTGLAARVMWRDEGVRAKLVIMDGVPGDPTNPRSNEIHLSGDEGALVVAELDGEFEQRARLWGGVWHYTADFETPFQPGQVSDRNSGWYLGYEQRFRLADRGMHAFVRIGEANETLNAIRDYVGAGLVVDAPFPSRPDDRLGLALASAGVGDPYRRQLEADGEGTTRRETVWELSYRAMLNDHFVLQPDVQWVVSPAATDSIGDALVFTLRVEWALWQ